MAMDKIEFISCMDRRLHQGWVWKVILFNMPTDKLGTYIGVGQ